MRNFERLPVLGTVLILILCNLEFAHATASTHIWAPSTDTQAWGTGHITADVYIPVELNPDGSQPNTVTNTGLTFGILPFKKLNAEAGFDYKTGYGGLDRYPIYFNAKIAVPEDALKDSFRYGEFVPAVAFGIYDIGTEVDKTNDNILYTKAAKTLKIKDFSLGRFSVGYFWGNDKLLLGPGGGKDANGILAAWERTMTEISDKLWLCVEYQGTKSSYGALNLGFSWQFTPSTSAIVGYQFYNNKNLADTATIQVDINF
jgi:hypothetical protein